MEIAKGKKSQIIWTKGLNKKFEEAVRKLGIDNAAPMKILELMKVDGLTRDQVSSRLQKYRILLKKIANDNYGVQTASKPSLFESTTASGAYWNNSSWMLNQEQMNMPNYSGMLSTNSPYLNTSSSCLPFFEDSGSLSTEEMRRKQPYLSDFPHDAMIGCFMQETENNLDDPQRNLIYDTTGIGVPKNSSNSGFVPDLDGFHYDCGDFATQVLPYNNIDMGSSIHIGNLGNSSFGENSNGFESNYSTNSEFVEMGSLYGNGSNSNGNLENAIVEDDLILSEVDIAYLISFSDDYRVYGRTLNNTPVTLDSLNQDVNRQEFQDTVSFDSNENEETPSINQQQTLDGYLPDFDPTYSQQFNEQFMDPLWSSQSLASDMTFETYF